MKTITMLLLALFSIQVFSQDTFSIEYINTLIEKKCKGSIVKTQNEQKTSNTKNKYKSVYFCNGVNFELINEEGLGLADQKTNLTIIKDNRSIGYFNSNNEKEINHLNFLINSNVNHDMVVQKKSISAELINLIK